MLKKILLICDKDVRQNLIRNISFEANTLEVVAVDKLDVAIEKIMANGFDLTIVQDDVKDNNAVEVDDIVKLNYLTGKQIIILTERVRKWNTICKKAFKSNPNGFFVCNCKKLEEAIKFSAEQKRVHQSEILKSVNEDLKQINKRKSRWTSIFSFV